MNEIEKNIVDILVDDLFISTPRADIDLNANLRTALGLDSLGFSELRAQCEYAFGVKIEDEDFNPQHFDSVHALAQLLTTLQAK